MQQAKNGTCTEYWDTLDGTAGERPLLIGAGYIASFSSQPRVGFDGSIARFAILNDQLDSSTIAELAAVKPDHLEPQLVEHTWARVYE